MRRLPLALLGAVTVVFASGPGHAALPPVEAYGRTPAVSELSLSPSGKRAAFLVDNAAGRRIAVQEVGGKILATVDPGRLKLRDIAWASDDFLLINSSATINLGADWGFKQELGRIEVLDLKTLKTMVVFETTPKISNVVLGVYGVGEKSGRWFGYFGGLSLEGQGTNVYANHGYPDLYQVDLETGATRLAANGGDKRHDWVVSPSGDVVAHSEYDAKKGEWRLLASGSSGGRELMTRNTPLDEISLIGQGRAPGTVLIQDGTGGTSSIWKSQ